MADQTSHNFSAGSGTFATTHWSRVVQAGSPDVPAATEALNELCRVYWYPLYAYARRRGCLPEAAEDATQSFLARLMESDFLLRAEPAKGRFRTFLLTAFQRFLANEWNREHAQKRGGFRAMISIDSHVAESRLGGEPLHGEQPDLLFDRHWAMTLLEQVMERLHREYLESGRAALFERLEACLARDETALKYAEIAAELNSTEAAVKMAMHRLRARYQAILREEIGKTVASPGDVETELKELFAAFQT